MTADLSKIELLTPDELAGLLKISKAGVYRLIAQREIPFFRVMRSIRFKKEDVINYLNQNRAKPKTEWKI